MEPMDEFQSEYRKVMQHRIAFWKKKFDLDEIQVIYQPASTSGQSLIEESKIPLVSTEKKQRKKYRILNELKTFFMIF
jgi:hypothetical protein